MEVSKQIVLLSFLVAVSGCKHVSEPPVVKSPREYTWTIDTLAYPNSFQTSMRDIWGSSANDVYVVGHNDQAFGKMWHYDGSRWEPVRLHILEGGPLPNIGSLSAIYGFSANDIWAVGEKIFYNPNPPPNFLDSSLIIHYDGVKWSEHKVSGRALTSVWGSSPSDIWVGGRDGLIHHFNGSVWQRVALDSSLQSLDYPLQILSIGGFSGADVYATAAKPDQVPPIDSTVIYLYHFNGEGWSREDSLLSTVGLDRWQFGPRLRMIGSALYSAGGGVFRKEAGGWLRLLDDRRVGAVAGVSGDNLFAAGNKVYHYNGVDWYLYRQLPDFNAIGTSVWTDGTEVFVVEEMVGAGYATITLILHGK